ncbi:dysbindin domain-containing protein 1 isoform X2 [Lepidochelys kempii]|uniref:dysbindin domain-containing protein 1 isoform X2 n=1 Tax=Lepidochelys kempii TaxID=8472 RepID=UPI003C6EAF1A
MEAPGGAGTPERIKEPQTLERAAGIPAHGPVEDPPSPPAEEQGGIPIPSSGLLQVAERRQPLSSVSSLEVHFDLLDLTELTDMSDQELAEVFADSDDENVTSESPAGRWLKPKVAPCCSLVPATQRVGTHSWHGHQGRV